MPGAGEPAVLDQINTALQVSDLSRATTLARDALAAGTLHPVLLNLRAYWYEGQGRDAEAFADLQHAQALAPKDFGIRNALGLAHARSGRHREAIECFDAVIALAPDFGPAHFNKGWASETLGEIRTARECYEHAHRLMPGNPDPPAGMAALAARRGDWPGAKVLAERALAIDPGHPIAITALAGAELAGGQAAVAESRLKALLGRTDLSLPHRSAADGLLGDLLDAQGQTAEAFAAYSTANEALRRLHAARFEGPGIETTPMSLRWLTTFFEAADPADWVAEPVGSLPDATAPLAHVFMVGFPRSGTTLLEQVLGSHPAVVTSNEKPTLDDATREFLRTPGDVKRLAATRGAGLTPHRDAYWQRVQEHGIAVAGRIFIDKQPYYTLQLPLILRLFPQAKIVFSVRDPRDVVLSCFRRRFLMSAPNFQFLTLEGAAGLYDETMRLAQLYRAKLPLDLLQLRHEDLVSGFEERVRETCDFLGLAWQDSMRDFATRARTQSITTPSSVQVMQGLNREGIGHWRRYRDQMTTVLPILQPWVERFGYPAN
ncbi:MAG: sulfotransferase [Betaproteobacteria bacterium]